MKISIIIPVYHEENNIKKVITQIAQTVRNSHEIIIVYDDKNDPTYAVIKNYKKLHNSIIKPVKNNQGNGKGIMNAIKTGFMNVKGEAIVVIMADLADDVRQIDHMFELINEGNDIVCASRFMKGGKKIGGPFIKNLLSRTACLTLYYLFHIPTHDATNAYKMYRTALFKNITIESKGGFEYSLEIIVKAFKKGYKIVEIPTKWKDREAGKSNFKLLSWLPNYVKWYLTVIPHRNFFQKYATLFLSILFTGLAIVISLFQISLSLKQGIIISSSLDFSWVTDAIERFMHGYIAGKDYIFTYGPLFQLLYSLPVILFHIPSYIAAAIAPLFVEILVVLTLFSLVWIVVSEKRERIFLFGFLLFIAGLVNVDFANIILRTSLPLLYATLWIIFLNRSKQVWSLIFISFLPSLFGAYSYDLFLQCFLISIVFSVYVVINEMMVLKNIQQLNWSLLAKNKNLRFVIFLTFGICLFQVIASLLISSGLQYTYYSMATIFDYLSVMNTLWEFGKSNYLFLFPLALPLFWFLVIRKTDYTREQKEIFTALFVASLLGLRAALVRSDSGHIEMSILPSIITILIYIFLLRRNMSISIFLVTIILFILLPFRQNYFGFISISNLKNLVSVIKTKPDFFALYKLPKKYYYTRNDINKFLKIIQENKGKVFVYPYDSYLLDINNTTYNSFPLQFYDYSNSVVEKKAITELQRDPPKIIILGIDTKGAIQLDAMANFTRNPLFAQWLITHYRIDALHDNYLILHYDIPTKMYSSIHGTTCKVYDVQIIASKLKIWQMDWINMIKPSLFFINNISNRIPFKTSTHNYYIFNHITTSTGIARLFLHALSEPRIHTITNSTLIEENPFTRKLKIINSREIPYKTYCIL